MVTANPGVMEGGVEGTVLRRAAREKRHRQSTSDARRAYRVSKDGVRAKALTVEGSSMSKDGVRAKALTVEGSSKDRAFERRNLTLKKKAL